VADPKAAREIIDHRIDVIETQWDDVCDQAGPSEADRAGFWHRPFLNPYATQDYLRTAER
jgi:serine/threonine-protein kinase HipA